MNQWELCNWFSWYKFKCKNVFKRKKNTPADLEFDLLDLSSFDQVALKKSDILGKADLIPWCYMTANSKCCYKPVFRDWNSAFLRPRSDRAAPRSSLKKLKFKKKFIENSYFKILTQPTYDDDHCGVAEGHTMNYGQDDACRRIQKHKN